MTSRRAERGGRIPLFSPLNPALGIDFAQGLPDPATFSWLPPIPEVLSTTGLSMAQAMQYTDTLGLPELRTTIARRQGVGFDSVLVTHGASQALQLICDALREPGDVVLTEDPSYLGALRTFAVAGAQLRQIPFDDDGIDIGMLDRVLRSEPGRVRLLYACPAFHNPTGRYVARARMAEIAALLAVHGASLVQDLVYAELYFEQAPEILAAGNNVINVHSMSKVAYPGLRIGWVEADTPIVRILAGVKREGGCGALASAVALGLLASADCARHIDRLRSHYRARRDYMGAMLAGLRFPHRPPANPRGGFSYWVKIASRVDPEALAHIARQSRGVLLSPGSSHGPSGEQCIRLCFSCIPLARIEEGLLGIDDAFQTLTR